MKNIDKKNINANITFSMQHKYSKLDHYYYNNHISINIHLYVFVFD